MTSTGETTNVRAWPGNLVAGAIAGLIAGIPLGVIMQVRDADPAMMPGIKVIDLVGDLISDPSTGLGLSTCSTRHSSE